MVPIALLTRIKSSHSYSPGVTRMHEYGVPSGNGNMRPYPIAANPLPHRSPSLVALRALLTTTYSPSTSNSPPGSGSFSKYSPRHWCSTDDEFTRSGCSSAIWMFLFHAYCTSFHGAQSSALCMLLFNACSTSLQGAQSYAVGMFLFHMDTVHPHRVHNHPLFACSCFMHMVHCCRVHNHMLFPCSYFIHTVHPFRVHNHALFAYNSYYNHFM